ncbi:ATP-binding protein [Allomuricauda sp. ARW1Y1]|jgi:signal transduction histidine kinase|uniref:sensor histidine kinase n=1 Tax=Allomuricauda sp. ARW1Y1 TaxID=2663843 RepID=UPI0015C7EDC3|nr:HAMP domain-containing sensor histidine kinase [Muricauda sp. ARW1Y1]NYJ28679.1 signal transduction histidine kinase [Muricauda sp. ARW1Y1]
MISSFLLDGELTEEEQKDTMGMLGRASEGLNETIGHLNEVVQVKLGIEKELSTISLKKVVSKIITDISALIQENKVVVDIMIPTSFKVQGVPAYIESIILNLVTNAIKYRDPDKRASITIEASLEEEYVKLSIKDNGMGIDLDKYGEKLFGMYKTFHGNKDAKGIGLFITKNQIESIGGRIAVESQVGVGTNFMVKLLKA